MFEPHLAKLISRLRPESKWLINGEEYDDLEWLDDTQIKPTLKELQDELKVYLKELEDSDYLKKRDKDYDEKIKQNDLLIILLEQIQHMQEKDGVTLTPEMTSILDDMKAIKSKYPKNG